MKDITLSLIQHLSWPLFVFFYLLVLRREIGGFLGRLRLLKAGTVELELSGQLQLQGFSEKQLATLKKLSAEDVDIFLLISFTFCSVKVSCHTLFCMSMPPDSKINPSLWVWPI